MRKLIINTWHPDAVIKILLQHQLIEHTSTWQTTSVYRSGPPESQLRINYPDDALSQEIVFWFSMAVGCGLVSSYCQEQQP